MKRNALFFAISLFACLFLAIGFNAWSPANSLADDGSGWDSDGAGELVAGSQVAPLATQATGTIYTSNLVEGQELTDLTGDVTLVVNEDRTLAKIMGRTCNLIITGSKTLTVNNTAGTAIDVRGCTVDANVIATGDTEGILIGGNSSVLPTGLTINGGTSIFTGKNRGVSGGRACDLTVNGGNVTFR